MDKEELEVEKIRLEIIKLKEDIFNERARIYLQYMVAVGGVIVVFLKLLGFHL